MVYKTIGYNTTVEGNSADEVGAEEVRDGFIVGRKWIMTDGEKAELADVYEKAAEYLEEYGWKKGGAGMPGGLRCFIGATASAVGEFECSGFWKVSNGPLWHRANEFAAEALDLPKPEAIMDWNDDPDRTKDEVINLPHRTSHARGRDGRLSP